MDMQEFNLSDGVVTGTVTPDSTTQRVTIRFDARDVTQARPVLDMDKYRNAVTHQNALRGMLQALKADANIDMPSMDNKGFVIMHADFMQAADFERAISALRRHTLQPPVFHSRDAATEPSPLETLSRDFQSHPEDMPDVAPTIREDETSSTHNYLQRLVAAETYARQQNTLTTWRLAHTEEGMHASVFPAGASILTGNPAPEGAPEFIAVRVTPGTETPDARATLYSRTHEVEKRLITRGMLLKTAEVYHGTDNSGEHDTGIILVKVEKNRDETLARVNEIVESVQHDHDVIRQKYGTRSRGEDHHHRGKVTTISVRPSPESLEDRLESNIRGAARAGIIDITGTPAQVDAWVKSLAAELRGQQRPGRPGNGTNTGTGGGRG